MTPVIASPAEGILGTPVMESQRGESGDTCNSVNDGGDSGDTCDSVTKEEIRMTPVMESQRGDSGDTCDGVTEGEILRFW